MACEPNIKAMTMPAQSKILARNESSEDFQNRAGCV
jgi:hypothetical protein